MLSCSDNVGKQLVVDDGVVATLFQLKSTQRSKFCRRWLIMLVHLTSRHCTHTQAHIQWLGRFNIPLITGHSRYISYYYRLPPEIIGRSNQLTAHALLTIKPTMNETCTKTWTHNKQIGKDVVTSFTLVITLLAATNQEKKARRRTIVRDETVTMSCSTQCRSFCVFSQQPACDPTQSTN